MTDPVGRPRPRSGFIDAAKGVLIVLVVFGHVVSSEDPLLYAHDWYRRAFGTVYAFHMPAFMFLSGHVFALAFARARSLPLRAYALSRANRLLVPFLAFGLAILLAKLAASHVLPVVNLRVDTPLSGLRSLVFDTGVSPARSIWFLWVLFFLSVFAMAMRADRSVLIALAAALVVANVVFFQEIRDLKYFYLNFLLRVAPFFFVGVVFGTRLDRFCEDAGAWLPTIAAVVFGAALVLASVTPELPPLARLLLSATAIVALYSWRSIGRIAALRGVGAYSMTIYLFNTLILGVLLVAAKKALPAILATDAAFAVYVLLACVTTVAVAMAVGAAAQRLAPRIGRYIV